MKNIPDQEKINNPTQGQSIKISSNINHRPVRRSPEDIKVVNVDELMPKKESSVPVKSIRDDAFNELDKAVARKQKEYRNFVENATIADKINRERIADGLEKTPEKEVLYRIQDMPQEVTKDPDPVSDEIKQYEAETELDDVEIDLENDLIGLDNPTASTHNIVIDNNPFDEVDIDEDNASEEEIKEKDKYLDTFTEEKHEEDSTKEPVIEEEKEEKPVAIAVATEDDNPRVDFLPQFSDDVAVDSNDIKKEENDEEISKEIIDGIGKRGRSVVISIPQDPIDSKSISNATAGNFNLDEADFEDVDEEEESNTPDEESGLTDEQIREIRAKSVEHLKSEILQKIVKTGKSLDTTQYAVSNKVVSIKDVLRKQKMQPNTLRTATWPLMFAGRAFTASALRGPEVSLLFEVGSDEDPNGVGITPNQINILYEHDMNPYKPPTPQAWAKTIPYTDLDNIFAALFVASLDGANYIPRGCNDPKCQYQFITDKFGIDDLIHFPNDETKKRFEEVRHIKPTPEDSTSYESVINVINDDFAVGLKMPSLYSMVYEFGTLNAAFNRKYASVVAVLQYIDYIYMIDPDSKEYHPIAWKIYAGDTAKSYRSKISTYSKIMQNFSDTDFSVLIALINTFTKTRADKMVTEFVIPEMRCPKCGAVIPEDPITAKVMVFMKQRLVNIATT